MKKRLSFLLVAFVLVLTSCAGGVTSASEETGTTPFQKTPETSEGVTSEKGKVTFWTSWKGPINGIDPGDSEYYKIIQEETNTEIEFISSAGGKEQLTILIASDDTPDMIEEWWGNFPGGITKNVSDGTLLTLNELMDNGKLPSFTSYVQSDQEIDTLCKTDDGQYYMLPLIRGEGTYTSFNGMAIRKDWLDELNLAMPETIADWTSVLTAFKNEKGASSPVSGFWRNFATVRDTFGFLEGFYVRDDTTILYGEQQEEYLAYLTLMNEWFTEGLLDPDLFTQNDDALIAKIATGETGAAFTSIGNGFSKLESLKENDPTMSWVAAPNPITDVGNTYDVNNSQYRVSNISVSIFANCKDIDAACRIADYPFTEKGIVLANYGVEGASFIMEDGIEKYTEFVTNNPDGYSLYDALAIYNGSGNKSFLQEKNQLVQSYELANQHKALEVWPTTEGSCRALPPVMLTDEEAQEFSSIMSDIETYTSEMKIKFITGTEPLSNFGIMQENLTKMQIERAVEIQQQAMNRFLDR